MWNQGGKKINYFNGLIKNNLIGEKPITLSKNKQRLIMILVPPKTPIKLQLQRRKLSLLKQNQLSQNLLRPNLLSRNVLSKKHLSKMRQLKKWLNLQRKKFLRSQHPPRVLKLTMSPKTTPILAFLTRMASSEMTSVSFYINFKSNRILKVMSKKTTSRKWSILQLAARLFETKYLSFRKKNCAIFINNYKKNIIINK